MGGTVPSIIDSVNTHLENRPTRFANLSQSTLIIRLEPPEATADGTSPI